MSAFEDLSSLAAQKIWDGVVGRPVHGERVTLTVIELDANASVPEHEHENEQIGVAISGSMQFRIGEETQDVAAGSTWNIAAHVPHSVPRVGPEGCVLVEVFAPPRHDWADRERVERRPLWP